MIDYLINELIKWETSKFPNLTSHETFNRMFVV
jgi:hypothetical protein